MTPPRTAGFRIRDGVAVITLDHPPANVLSHGMRVELAAHFARIATLPDVRGVVLMGAGDGFSVGADIREMAMPQQAPTLAQVCDAVEGCRVPVVAALHGTVMGGGAELALAAHYRIAAGGTGIGLPDVTLGLVPGAGGTQRLPRLVGAVVALDLLLSGRSLYAKTCREAGLIDGIVTGDLGSAALAFVADLLAKGQGPRPTRDRRAPMVDGAACLDAVAQRRAAIAASRFHAPMRALDCVEAAVLLPFEAGMAFEAAAFETCRAHPQSRALRHIYLAERRVSADLLTRTGAAWTVTSLGQSSVVVPMTAALGHAAAALARNGHDPAQIDAAVAAVGVTPAPMGTGATAHEDPAVTRPIVAALMAEAARLAARGTIAHPADADALCVHGMGFARRLGGPVQMAQDMGLVALRDDMRHWAELDPVWDPPPLLSEAVKYAAGFDALVPVVRSG